MTRKAAHIWGYVDERGEWAITPAWEAAGTFSDDRAWVRRDGKPGFIDTSGTLVVECTFEAVWPFSGGLARVSPEGYEHLSHVIDRTGTACFSRRERTWEG